VLDSRGLEETLNLARSYSSAAILALEDFVESEDKLILRKLARDVVKRLC
jgi:geranylgeranyl pyrophosphate synthase